MKARLTMKWPDHELSNPDEAACQLLGEQADDDAIQALIPKIEAATNKFLEYGEYLTVEIDLDTLTATVIPAK